MAERLQTAHDPFVIAGEELGSRLIMGTGGAPSLDVIDAALAASGTALCTVAMRRLDPSSTGSILDVIDRRGVRVLPNTAGCRTAREAVRTAEVAREALETDWVKLEVVADERTLLHACSGHFTTQNPLPDPGGWADEADPESRVRRALCELYAYWEQHQQMVTNVLRDAEVMEVVREVSGATWGVELGAMRETLVADWPKKAQTPELEAIVELAQYFRTWQSLVGHSGLNSAAAADLMTRVVAGVAG